MKAYDDVAYLKWCENFQEMVDDYLEVEGNTVSTLVDELENCIDNSSVLDDVDDSENEAA